MQDCVELCSPTSQDRIREFGPPLMPPPPLQISCPASHYLGGKTEEGQVGESENFDGLPPRLPILGLRSAVC
jgi:hypothetical protein